MREVQNEYGSQEWFFFLMMRQPPRSTQSRSSAASDVYKRQMTHMGRQYGLPNQIANLIVCLVLVASVAAGLTLWWKRRPKGELGDPQLDAGNRMPGGAKALIAALAFLFPLVGAIMILSLIHISEPTRPY